MKEVTATPVNNDVSTKFDVTCTVSWDVSELSYTPTVSWKLTDKDGTAKPLTTQSEPYKYTVASAKPGNRCVQSLVNELVLVGTRAVINYH